MSKTSQNVLYREDDDVFAMIKLMKGNALRKHVEFEAIKS